VPKLREKWGGRVVFIRQIEKYGQGQQRPGSGLGWGFPGRVVVEGSLRIFAGFAGFLQVTLRIVPAWRRRFVIKFPIIVV